jgi:general secretion pathway protein K
VALSSRHPGPRRQRGLALLMAMLIVVIATTVAVSIVHEEKFTIRKNAHIQSQDRAALYAAGLEDFARILLREDSEENKIDGEGDFWEGGIQVRQIEGGFIGGFIEDEQARFNLNSLVDSTVALTRFKLLCDNLEVDDQFIPALLDWLDEDSDIRYPDGMEENYENYRVANREMADISELLLVHNVTPEIFEKLQPHITALPGTSTLNVNTMSETIYLSLAPDLNADDLIKEREDALFEDIDDFVTRLQVPVDTEGLSVDTRFFRAHGEVIQGDQSFKVTTLIYRDDQGDTRIINRTLGQF